LVSLTGEGENLAAIWEARVAAPKKEPASIQLSS
jgi:hypothetical protein